LTGRFGGRVGQDQALKRLGAWSRSIAEEVAIAVLSRTIRRPSDVIDNAGLAMEREKAVPGVGLAREAAISGRRIPRNVSFLPLELKRLRQAYGLAASRGQKPGGLPGHGRLLVVTDGYRVHRSTAIRIGTVRTIGEFHGNFGDTA
jgi:hypothetical protein